MFEELKREHTTLQVNVNAAAIMIEICYFW